MSRPSKEVRKKRELELRNRAIKKMDNEEKIRRYIAGDLDKSELDQKSLKAAKNLRKVWLWASQGYPTNEVVKKMIKKGICERSQAYNLIYKAREVFGIDLFEASRHGELAALVEMARNNYRLAIQEKDVRAANAAVKLIAELQGVLDQHRSLVLVYEDLELPTIEITSDPSAVYDAEEVEFEEA